MSALPIVDLRAEPREIAREIRAACTDHGFFYVANHGVEEALLSRLDALARAFFALPLEEKNEIAMAKSGRAWRGYFPVGGELTSGAPDLKEGLYFGAELPPEDPRVLAKTPLHGANPFPSHPSLADFRPTTLATIDALTALGHRLLRGVAESLALPAKHFETHSTKDPTLLFRIFHYPAREHVDRSDGWGVGEHTDYGLLTILKQDDVGGLEVKSSRGWIAAPPIAGTFVCNIGDMLERMTGGFYRSTPHRVKSDETRDRLSFPFFFDPSWDAKIEPLDLPEADVEEANRRARWDRASVFDFGGTYGEYLVAKVSKVFPALIAR